ncbi:MAG TPA: hypothetical protein ENH25_07720 [candidate division Zixibacteria bacterium]|nr:hypothetical protein [candidate division Zixibacteria bacterium]
MTTRNSKILLGIILAAAAAGLYYGWIRFWFLTDDAFIAFRYASNSIDGLGYVWNPPPFKAVEGYTSFLWVIIVEYIWRIFGVIPPKSANVISLGFSFMTILLTAMIAWRMNLTKKLSCYRLIIIAAILLGTLSNRTFLAWSSSGLETAMFNFLVLWWIFIAVFAKKYNNNWRLLLTGTASLVYLARPDGILAILGTLAIVTASYINDHKQKKINVRRFLSILPLLIVPLHLLWRKFTYGEWLPNTYYAKYVAAWPESGLRYFASFVLEYALWFWIGLLLILIASYIRNRKTSPAFEILSLPQKSFNLCIVIIIIILHIGYYTLIIGGDHFEYRVYGYLIPLIFISFVWIINRMNFKPVTAAILFALFFLLSLPVPWTHWSLTHRFYSREQTHVMQVPIHDRFPGPFRWYARWFDDLQSWLIQHHVCMRHQEHKVFCRYLKQWYPSREEGGRIPFDGYPVMAKGSVGVPGWVFPHVAVIDRMGLNDYIIARYNRRAREERLMAHDRMPPPGYLESLMINVSVPEMKKIEILPRPRPLTGEMIRNIEKYWTERINREK